MIKLITLTAATALLTGCASDNAAMARSSTGEAADTVATQPAVSSVAYVQAAGASDQFEIQSSQVALTMAQRSEVRAFAQMMVDHHTKTTADLMAAAKQAGMTPPPPALSPEKTAKIAALKRADVAGFDAMYMREQMAGHIEALALHQGYAKTGDQAALREAASQTVPIVAGHLERARALASPG